MLMHDQPFSTRHARFSQYSYVIVITKRVIGSGSLLKFSENMTSITGKNKHKCIQIHMAFFALC